MLKLCRAAWLLVIASMLLMVAGRTMAVVDPAVSEKIISKLSAARPDIQFGAVELSPIQGVYQVQVVGGPMLYVGNDGNYFIAGDLFAVRDGGFVNLQEQKLQLERADQLARIPQKKMVVFKPEGEVKRHIYIFTDIDCGYCRKLHGEVPELLKMGIEVRYLAYPRAGIPSPSYDKIATAWCAKNPQETLTRLKRGEKVAVNVCEGNPVAEQFALGGQLGVKGTPAIIMEDGTMLPGYLPAATIGEWLGL